MELESASHDTSRFADAREAEAELLSRCVQAARGEIHAATNAREANVFWLASMVLPESLAPQSRRLGAAAQAFFDSAPGEQLDAGEVVRRGWVVSLPRLRQNLAPLLERPAGR